MKTSITIAPSNIPSPSPVLALAVIFLLLEHFGAPDYAYWVFGVLAFLTIWGWLLQRKNAIVVDLFSEAKKLEKRQD